MTTTALDIIRANFEARRSLQGELRELDEKLTADKRPPTDEERALIDEKRAALESIDERIQANLKAETTDQEIRGGMESLLGVMVDRDRGDVVDARTIGERFAQADGLEAHLATGARGSFAVDMPGVDHRAVGPALTTGSAGAFVEPQRLARMGQDLLDRRVFLSDLIPSTPVTGPIEYVQDKTPAADLLDLVAEVAEGAEKPLVGITPELVQEKIATVAAATEFSRQAQADAPFLQGLLDGRLRYGLRRRKDNQIVGGNGTGANLLGLANRPNIATVAPGAAEDRAVSIRKAITAGELLEAVYEIVVLNPADAEKFDLTHYDADGLHAVPNLAAAGARTAWGLQQVRSNAVPAGTALLIDPMALLILDRQQPTAYLTDSHAERFLDNILTLLLELRMGLALFYTAGVCKVTFNGAA